ncbi:XkdF-like serine protease domain-containing protein [Pseudomonas phage vB_PseuGesM_254]|uniref:XkdF-like serine protease domain-containing protein n=1 Tax=Pseudomonas phage vB_PseuGesM_254 TaxID=3092638 RepID=A0AAX4G6E1_9CAUD|nr:XkdF-like serine protease domain-containing protein [Pseudomonas phage PseuGes_254]
MKFADALTELIEKHFGGSKKEAEQVEVTKALDTEQRMALFVVLEPDTVDLHGDIYDAVEVEKACNNFNTFCRTANIFHQIETQEANIVQSYIAPVDFQLDNGVDVKKGTWLQWWHFPEGSETSDLMWSGVQSGEFNGVSIGAKATVEDIE